MPTTLLRLGYRPLRIGFLVRKTSMRDVRRAIQLSSLLWGGQLNPLVGVAREPEEVDRDIAAFQVDALHAVSSDNNLAAAVDRNAHLRWPIYGDDLVATDEGAPFLRAIDLRGPMRVFSERRRREPPSITPAVVARWEPDDPYAAVYAATFGDFSLARELLGDDVLQSFVSAAGALEADAASAVRGLDSAALPLDVTTIGLSWLRDAYWREATSSIYIGNPRSAADVRAYWNLRASDTHALFWDRTADGGPFREAIRQRLEEIAELEESRRPPFGEVFCYSLDAVPRGQPGHVAEELTELFPAGLQPVVHSLVRDVVPVSPWREFGFTELPATDREGVLAHVDDPPESDRSKVVIPLPTFRYGAPDRQRQDLVVSVDPFTDSGYRGTLRLPPLRDLAPSYAYDLSPTKHIRIEGDTFGVIDNLLLETLEVWPLTHREILERLFSRAGLTANRSLPGEAAWQLLRQLGGLSSSNVLRLPGVRELLSLTEARVGINRKKAEQIIQGSHGFAEAEPLFLRARSVTPKDIFGFFTARKLFLPGLWLQCPRCQHASFFPVRDLDDDVRCPRCTDSFALGPALVGDPIRFRLSGLLEERSERLSTITIDAQPTAIPVLLTLLFLSEWVAGLEGLVLEVSHEISGPTVEACESDFIVIEYGTRHEPLVHVLVGECKGQGSIDGDDIRRLQRVAAAMRDDRVGCDVVFATTRDAFSDEEMDLFRAAYEASADHEALRRPPILLTRGDLESPSHRDHDDRRVYRFRGLEGLVWRTHDRYFPRPDASAPRFGGQP